jgi:hypothetical protein
VEARAAYWILKRSAKPGFRPYAVLSGGIAEVDGRLSVNIQQSQAQRCADPSGTCPATRVGGRIVPVAVDAWRAGGLAFVSLGVGAMYQFLPRWGVYLELKMAEMFPTTSLTGAAQLGASMGL